MSSDSNRYESVYEFTPYKLFVNDEIFVDRSKTATSSSSSSHLITSEIIHNDHSAFLLHNLLSPSECQSLIEQATNMHTTTNTPATSKTSSSSSSSSSSTTTTTTTSTTTSTTTTTTTTTATATATAATTTNPLSSLYNFFTGDSSSSSSSSSSNRPLDAFKAQQLRFRVCDRLSAMSPDLAAILFERAKPFLRDVRVPCNRDHREDDDQYEIGVTGLKPGIYKPVSINPCFRIIRYNPGGFFLPHYDGGFSTSTTVSIKTFMIYLNTVPVSSGGPTRFFTQDQEHYKSVGDHKETYAFQPREGSCLVFNHAITHDGGTVKVGQKWLARTEVMYRRQDE